MIMQRCVPRTAQAVRLREPVSLTEVGLRYLDWPCGLSAGMKKVSLILRPIGHRMLGAGAYVKKPYILEKLGLAVRKELDRNV